MIWAAHISPSDNSPTSNLSCVLLQNATNRHARLNSFSTSPQSAKYGVNQFSDLSQKEFRGRFVKLCKICRAGSSAWACSIRWNVFCLFYIFVRWASHPLDDWDESANMCLCIQEGLWTVSAVHRSVPASECPQSSSLLWTEDRGAAGQIWLERQRSGGAGPEPTSSMIYTDWL